MTAFNACMQGVGGGKRTVLDIIADRLRDDSISHYYRHVMDDEIPPNDYDTKLEAVRQIFQHFGRFLPAYIDRANPARYAHNYHDLIRALSQSVQTLIQEFQG